VTTPRAIGLRRIVVALDMSPHSLAALAAAAVLAQGDDVELVGVFVEDVNWLRHGQLPAARVISRYNLAKTNVQCEEVQRALASRAEAAARALARLAEAQHLRWSFSVARGTPPEAVAAAAADADLVTLGRAGWPTPGQRAVGTVTRRVVTDAPAHTLILAAGQRLSAPVVLWVNDPAAAGTAGALATSLAARLGGGLHVLVTTKAGATATAVQDAARAALAAGTFLAAFEHLPTGPEPALLAALHRLRPGVLVAPGALVGHLGIGLTTLLDHADCPVLLTRG
jgi:nucleotide-binding universal stress UspA family protein